MHHKQGRDLFVHSLFCFRPFPETTFLERPRCRGAVLSSKKKRKKKEKKIDTGPILGDSPRTPKSNANARAAQLLTQTGQIGAYILRSAFSVGYFKAHPVDSDCANRSVNLTLRFSGHRRQLCGANLENSNQSESESVTAARVNFSREYLALKTRNFVNDVDQRS